MSNYQVTWEIDIEADCAENAALQAAAIMLDPASTATVLQVCKDEVTTVIDTEGGKARLLRDGRCEKDRARARILLDSELSATELDAKYNPDGDGEQPNFPRSDWCQAVANKDTISGYWSWVEHSLYQAAKSDGAD